MLLFAKNILNFVSLLPWETWCLEYLVIYNFEYSLKKLITKDDNSTEELKEPNPEDKSQKKPHNSMFSLTKSEQTIDMEGVADYKFTTREYVSRDGTKKRLTAIAVECYNPLLKHENFKHWYLMDFRTRRVSNFIPSFAKSCIKIVGDVEDLTKTLDDFTKVSFFLQCSKMQLIPLKKFNIQTCFFQFLWFFILKC